MDSRYDSGMALEQETAAFSRALPELLADQNAGRFALVHAEHVDSVWDSVDEALEAGYERFGLDPFMVKEIVEREQPIYCSRNVRCPS